MSKRPGFSPVLIAIVGVALLGLVGLNVFAQRTNPVYQKKQEEERQAQEAEKAQKQAEEKAKQSPVNAPLAAGSADIALWGAEKTFGPAKAKQEVVVAYSWTPDIQSDPSKIGAVVEALTKAAPDARIRVVAIDAALADGKPAPPAGLSVGGKLIAPPDASGALTPDSAVHAAQEALGIKHAD